jgi:hypothetical protein
MDKILSINASNRKNKKYVASVKGKDGAYNVHFGDSRYEQYKDSTPNELYAHKNHSDISRRDAYFKRHSGTNKKQEALRREISKSGGRINAKILSHKFLW